LGKLAWSKANETAEVLAEMALVNEADFQRNVGNWASLLQQCFGVGDPKLHYVCVGRQARCRPKHPQQMHGAKLGEVCEVVEGDVFGVMRHQIFLYPPHDPMFGADRRIRELHMSMAREE